MDIERAKAIVSHYTGVRSILERYGVSTNSWNMVRFPSPERLEWVSDAEITKAFDAVSAEQSKDEPMTMDELSVIPVAKLGDWISRSRAVDADGVLWFIWTDHDGNRWRYRS